MVEAAWAAAGWVEAAWALAWMGTAGWGGMTPNLSLFPPPEVDENRVAMKPFNFMMDRGRPDCVSEDPERWLYSLRLGERGAY